MSHRLTEVLETEIGMVKRATMKAGEAWINVNVISAESGQKRVKSMEIF